MENQKLLDNMWVRAITGLCIISLFLFLGYFLRGILISLFLAFTIAYIFDPAVDFIAGKTLPFTKRHVPRGLAIGVLLTGLILIMGGLLTYTVPKTITGIQRVGAVLKDQYPKYQESVEKIIEEYRDTEIGAFLIVQLEHKTAGEEDDAKSTNQKEAETSAPAEKKPTSTPFSIPQSIINLKKYAPEALNFVIAFGKNIFFSTFGFFGIVMNILLFGVVTVYLLKDFDAIVAKGRGLLPLDKTEKVSDIFKRIDENLRAFFRGQITVCVILTFIYGTGLTVIGTPMSYLLAILGGFGNIIPYIGICFGLVPALILTYIQYPDMSHLLLVGIVFGVGQFLEGTLITPKIVGTKLGLNPVAIILAILVCSQLLGFLGLLLAVPILSVCKVLIDEGIVKYKGSKFFRGR
ncbi:MAG: AI-2E family transporter [Planctomycetes bacterium]|nr:AI-2E family transporter [Planctomycetota bacterium]